MGQAKDDSSTVRTAPARVHTRFVLSKLYQSGEHQLLGNSATLHLTTGPPMGAEDVLLYVPPSMNGLYPKELHYGQIVALGGDLYGDQNRPISTDPDPVGAFKNAFAKLADGTTQELNAILAVLNEEMQDVQNGRSAGKQPSEIYAALGSTLDGKYNIATGGAFSLDPTGRYLALAAVNWDHFGVHAVAAYQAGHQVAMQFAAGIQGSNRTPDQKQSALTTAYAYNAFADHFLTDLFASGHLRTPRKELYDLCAPFYNGGHVTGSLLARCMHAEDNQNGLIVYDAGKDKWQGYGDQRLLDGPDADNLARAENAVQRSIDEVWTAYQTQSPPKTWKALTLIPDLARVRNTSSRENPSPLFIVKDDGTVECRKPLRDTTTFDWHSFYPPSILAQLELPRL